MPVPPLYRHQLEDVVWFQSLAAKHAILAHDPGLGKSVSALAIAESLGAKTVLILTPRAVCRAWNECFQKFAPQRNWWVLPEGSARKRTTPAQCRYDFASSAHCLIVSWDLAGDPLVVLREWDFVVMDELHQFTSPRSQTFGVAQQFASRAKLGVLGLTATPMTAEPVHSWTPLSMVAPGQLGRKTRSGTAPWGFQKKFGNEVVNDYGVSYQGLREDAADAFKTLLSKFVRRRLRADVGDILPPVDIRPYFEPEGMLPLAATVALTDCIAFETQHTAIYTWHVERAREIFNKIAISPRYRNHQVQLVTSKDSEFILPDMDRPSLLIATIGSIGVGISLSYIKQYLVAEPISGAHILIQLDGRHTRLDRPGDSPAIGHIQFKEGRDDALRDKLRARLDAYAAAMKVGDNVNTLRAAVAQAALTPDSLLTLLGNSYRGDVEDDDND